MSSAETREALLQAAWRLMKEEGATTTLGTIAREAGVSRQALYLHFESRAGLLLAMVRWVDEREHFAEQVAPLADCPEPLAQLEGYVRAWLDYLPRLHPVPGLLARAKGDPDARAAWADRMSALESLYLRPVRELKRDRALATGLTPTTAVQAIRAVASVEAWEMLVPERGWPQRHAVDTLWRAAAAAVVAT